MNTTIEVQGHVAKGWFDVTIKDPYIEFDSNTSKGFVDLRLVSFCICSRTNNDALSLIFFLTESKTTVTFTTPDTYGGPAIIPYLESFYKAYNHTMGFIKEREARLSQIAKESAS